MVSQWCQHWKDKLKGRVGAVALGAVLATGGWSARADAQTITPPPDSSFSPAVEVACTALDTPNRFSKRVVPANPDTQTDVKLIIATDNQPFIDLAPIRVGTNQVDLFIRVVSTLSPFPYMPLFRCYEVPIGRFSEGAVQIVFVRALSSGGAPVTNYIRGGVAFDPFSFVVSPGAARDVPTLQNIGLLLLIPMLLLLARRGLRDARARGRGA
jgi:hypothetical protein